MSSADLHVKSPAGFTIAISAQRRDHILITTWFLTTFHQFKLDELILYPLALYFAYAFARDSKQQWPLVAMTAFLFGFPVWNLLSLLWGVVPSAILKYTAQSFLTMMICYCAAMRLTLRQIVQSLLITAGYFGVVSLVLPGNGPTMGVFTSKNQLGLNMALLWAVALCVLLDRAQPKILRLIALALTPVALILVFRSNSATAVLLAFGAASVIGLGLLLVGRGLGHPMVLITMFLVCACATIGLSTFMSSQSFDLFGYVLDKFGKDATLTGRTQLWGYAIEQIRQRPLLGVGAGGFWHPQDWTSLSRRIFVDYYKPFTATFTFHNSYLQVAVHQGLIGAAIAIFGFLWAVKEVFFASLKNTTMPHVFFVVLASIILARNFTEPGLVTPFSLFPMLLYMGALICFREKLAARSQNNSFK